MPGVLHLPARNHDPLGLIVLDVCSCIVECEHCGSNTSAVSAARVRGTLGTRGLLLKWSTLRFPVLLLVKPTTMHSSSAEPFGSWSSLRVHGCHAMRSGIASEVLCERIKILVNL